MEALSPSTVNVRLSAVGKLVAEARRNGLIGVEDAASLSEVPNIRQKGTRLGNWLTREQAKELLAVPDRSTLKGKRDYAILALLVGCALRRHELANLYIEKIQLPENPWVITDLRGKGGRVRPVAVPVWVKQGVNAWTTAAGLEKGKLLRPVLKSGKVVGESLSDWAVWSVVETSARGDRDRRVRGPRPAPDLRQALPQERRRSGADQVPARSLVDPDDGTLPRVRAGNRDCGKRQSGVVTLGGTGIYRV
jgi:integrase